MENRVPEHRRAPRPTPVESGRGTGRNAAAGVAALHSRNWPDPERGTVLWDRSDPERGTVLWEEPEPERDTDRWDGPEISGQERRLAVRAARQARRARMGVESNARLTGLTAGVLLVLLAAEGFTILRIRQLVTPHVFIGMLLLPPVLVKIGSTGWRFTRYYRGAPAYRRKGPPAPLLRLLGPVLVLLTGLLIGSGVALLLVPTSLRRDVYFVHKASFVLWFGVMAIHVLGHIVETTSLAPADLVRRTRNDVRGARARVWLVSTSLVVGLVLALVTVPLVGHWLATGGPYPSG